MINPMQMMNLFNQVKGSNNPMGMMQQMFGGDPAFSRAMEMSKGKNPQELETVAKNLCQQRGIDFEQAKGMLTNLGIKL